ncbi:MAG: GNAT family N-acetyltransferase, partial [Anaerolineales bacterium]
MLGNRPTEHIMFTRQRSMLRDIGNGLIMRRSLPADADALAEFNARLHSDDAADAECLKAWTHDLLSGNHPTFSPNDFTIIEESASGRIVSTMNTISQTWSYEGIKFGVGRPELVGTLPEFRNRGLVRLQFEEIHKWSAERGELVQAITGIPFYYRQFGYEMALDLDGRRLGYEAQVPKLKQGEADHYLIRAAREDDLPFIEKLNEQMMQRSMIACVRTPEIVRYELSGRGESNQCMVTWTIEDKAGERVGFFRHSGYNRQKTLVAALYELRAGVPWLEVTPAVIRHLWAKGQECANRDGSEFNAFGFMLGASHPVYEALGNRLPTIRDPYAWYVRVPDLLGFLNHIGPVLEKRLGESVASGHSREIRISFYRTGLRMVIENGKFISIES